MKARREEIELFDLYLQDALGKEERLLLESKLATDEELAEEFELHKLITAGIASEKEQRFREVLRQQREDTFIGNNTWGKKFTLVSAAVVLIGMLVMVYATYLNYNPGASPLAKKNQIDTPATEQKSTQQKESQREENTENPIAKLERDADSKELSIQENVEEEVQEDDITNEIRDAAENRIVTPTDAGQTSFDNIPAIENIDFEDDDVEVVKKDKLEGQEVLYAKVVAVAESITLQEVTTTKSAEKLVARTSKKIKTKANQSEEAKEEADEASTPVKTKSNSSVDSTQKYTVQYYNSPLNYKGYKYNSKTKTIQVYGMKGVESQLIMRANVLFLKNGEDYFIITPNKEFSPLNKLSNQDLINQLK